MISVDFCRGPAGAFLAIGNLVVAGDCTGGGRTIMSFEVDEAQVLRGLELHKAGSAEPGKEAVAVAIATPQFVTISVQAVRDARELATGVIDMLGGVGCLAKDEMRDVAARIIAATS